MFVALCMPRIAAVAFADLRQNSSRNTIRRFCRVSQRAFAEILGPNQNDDRMAEHRREAQVNVISVASSWMSCIRSDYFLWPVWRGESLATLRSSAFVSNERAGVCFVAVPKPNLCGTGRAILKHPFSRRAGVLGHPALAATVLYDVGVDYGKCEPVGQGVYNGPGPAAKTRQILG